MRIRRLFSPRPGGVPSFAIAVAVAMAVTCQAAAASTAFSYQGRLLQAGAPAEGVFDLRFQLFNEAADGMPSSEARTNAAVTVSNGLFTTVLDFGANVFAPAPRWLEIGVRPGGVDGEFILLRPRQPLTPTPYSLYTLRAASLDGPLPESQLPANVARLDGNQVFTGSVQVQGTIQAGTFGGDGSGLSNVLFSGLSARFLQRLWRQPLPFVTITNAGNAADSTGFGAVGHPFRMGKFEVNNHQYAAFLNAVATEDRYHLYSTNMTLDVHGGIERTGSAGDHRYKVKPGHEHRPVVWVDFHDALRFCNWLHNGQPAGPQDGTTTEDGAYTLTPSGIAANTIVRNPGARFWLPNGDEWYKAAYHHPAPAGGDASDYWDYPTRSNDVPFSSMPPGDPNSINACCEAGRLSTDVGAYRFSPSFYGTFDQGGNVQEWTEEIVFMTNRRLRGGSWDYNEFYASVTDFEFDTPDYDSNAIGFRVAGAAEEP